LKAEGYWEQEGHNPLTGALIFVLLIGGIYFIMQALVLNGYIIADMRWGDRVSGLQGGYFERLTALYKIYQKPILTILIFSQFLIFFIPTILVYRKWHYRDWIKHFRLDRFSLKAAGSAALGSFLFLPLADFLSSLFFYAFPGLEKLSSLQAPLFQADSTGGLFFLLLAIAVTPAICEEILFRGYLQTVVERKISGFRIILITGVLFGLYHQNPMGILALVTAGIWLGLLAWKFKSLYASMVGHLVYNSSVILIYNNKIGSPFINNEGHFPLTVSLIFTALFAGLVYWIWKYGGIEGGESAE